MKLEYYLVLAIQPSNKLLIPPFLAF